MVTVTSAVQGPVKAPFSLWQCGSSKDGFVTLGCLTRGLVVPNAVTHTFSGGTVSDVLQYPPVQASDGYTVVTQARVPAKEWEGGNKFTCSDNEGNKSPVAEKPRVVELPATLLLTTQSDIENGTATLICLAKHFSPKTHTFTWTRGQSNLDTKVKENILSQDSKTKTYSAISILELPGNEWTGTTEKVACKFQQPNRDVAKREASFGDIVTTKEPEVIIIPPSASDMLIKRGGNLVCKAKDTQGAKTSIKWSKNNQVTACTESPEGDDKLCTATISFTEWSNDTEFVCEVEHPSYALGFKTATYQREKGIKKEPKVYLLAPPEKEITESTVTLSCYVKKFYPKEVAVSWLADDKLVANEDFNTTTIEKEGYFSAYSKLVVEKSEWENGVVYTCRAYHESIADPVRFISRSISHSNPATLVNLDLKLHPTAPCSRR